MANSFGIPPDIEEHIRERDKVCVYCSREMHAYPGLRGSKPDKATIEHLNELPPFHWRDGLEAEGIGICCQSCNSSRGVKPHAEWFRSPYCIERGITADTVTAPVRAYLSSLRSPQ